MTLRRILVGSFVTNCYLMTFSDRICIVDPGEMPEKILKACGTLPITDILLTHGHLDHTAALGDLCDQFNPRVYLHKDDADFLNDDALRAPISPAESWWRYDFHCTDPISDGDEITLGNEKEALTFQVIHTPGHTPGSVCFYSKERDLLFSGDTLFKGTEGRTDFPRGDKNRIRKSLQKLSLLPPQTTVSPGHGFGTKIGDEPWIRGDSF